MSQRNLRHQARECLSQAKKLLNAGDKVSLRYACLELRFCIEYIAYDQMEAYLAEVPDDAVKKWTPKQIISEMLEVDPQADQSATIAIGLEEIPGTPAKNMKIVGEDRRFTMKWANSSHNALGNFLHAPTLDQIDSGQQPTPSTIAKKAKEIVGVLDHILASPISRVNMGIFYNFKCECGASIKRRSGSFTKEQGIVCPNSKCRAIYDVVSDNGEIVSFCVRSHKFDCPECAAPNHICDHHIKPGNIVTCGACGDRKVIKQQFVLAPLDAAPGSVVQ